MGKPARLTFTFNASTLDDFVDRYAVDVTRTGFFLRTTEVLPVGTDVEFDLHLADGSELLSGRGTVAWVKKGEADTTGGVGVRFERLSLAGRRMLDAILRPSEMLDTERERASGSFPTVRPPTGEARAVSAGAGQAEALVVTGDHAALGAGSRDRGYVPPPSRDQRPTGPAWMATGAQDDAPRSAWLSWLVLLALLAGAGYAIWYFVFAEPGQPAVAPVAQPAGLSQDAVARSTLPSGRAVSLAIASRPEGAQILIDGRDSGQRTPATVSGLDPRVEVEIALVLAGHKVARRKLAPVAGKPLSVTLEEGERRLTVDSQPPGALLRVDGQQRGQTPQVLTRRLREGNQLKLQLTLDGYRPAEQVVDLARVAWQRVSDGLEAGSVSVPLSRP